RERAVVLLIQAVQIYDKLDHAGDDTMGSDTKDVLNRKRLRALVHLARLQAKLKKLDAAKDSFKRALVCAATLSEYNEADLKKEYLSVVTKTGDTAEASHVAREIEVSSGTETDVDTMIMRATDSIGGGDLKDAEKDLTQALRLARELDTSSKVQECLVRLGVCRIVLGQNDSAKVALEEAITINHPLKVDALQLLAYVSYVGGQRALSDRLFDESVQENIKFAVDARQLFLVIRAFHNRQERRAATAVAKFCLMHHTRLLSNLAANKASLESVLAIESEIAGDPEAGVKHWRSLAKLSGKSQDLGWLEVPQLTGIADAFSAKGNSEEAEKYWRMALEKLDKDPGRLTSYARQLAYQIYCTERSPKQYEEVVKLMYKAWRYMPLPLSYPLSMLKQDLDLVENTYRKMGIQPDRKKIFSTLLMYAEKWNAPDLLAYTLEQLGKCNVVERNFAAAVPLLERAISLKRSLHASPDDLASDEIDLVSCYYNVGDDAKFKSYVGKLMEIKYKDKDNEKRVNSCCYLHLGAIFDREGKSAEADAMYEKGNRSADPLVAASLIGTIAGSLDVKRKEDLLMKQLALLRKQKAKPSLEEGVLCTILADQFNGDKRYEEAEHYYKLALDCFKPFEKTEGGMHFLKIWQEHHACLLSRVAAVENRPIPSVVPKKR
ncbi:MAG: hypothetical protein K2X93_20985, partial [Candidatus Obscuribacterales bacterium]|nr:hypothetical protein [Candidatus Obscuribacterales bacterium]